MINQGINRKSIIWFILISFPLAWAMFLLPLVGGAPGTPGWQKITAITWALGMWAPGLAAILVTRLVEKKPLSSLNLRKVGPANNYLLAWLVPILMTIAAGLLTWLFGVGKLDLEFSAIRQALAQSPTTKMEPAMVVLIQIALGFTLGPVFNTIFALGEELGWRGFLLGRLEPLGQLKAIGLSGIIWGIWHAPAILQGHNYPKHPIPGVFLMVVFCVLFGTFLSWLYLRSRSPWTAAFGHGSLNAVAGLPVLFMPGVNLALGGPITSVIGWIPMILFAAWLIWTKRLPVPTAESIPAAEAAQ